MKRILAPPDWIPFPHPSFWPGIRYKKGAFGFQFDEQVQQVESDSIPWETTQLNSTKDFLFDYTYIETDDPPRFIPFEFEFFDWKGWCIFGTLNWHLPFLAGALYLLVIFSLNHYMQNRQPYNLKWPLVLWNGSIGIFSIIGFIRTSPEFFSIFFTNDGFYKAICYRDGGNYPSAFWSLLFVLSKYVELGDTIFIILRKKPLLFIQWYHHFVTLIMAWLTAPYIEAIARWYVVMNYGVHSLMYPYFTLRALDVKIPRGIAPFITTCQLAQMLIGLGVNFLTAFMIWWGIPCYRHPFSIKLSAIVYGSFTILFGKLFYDIIIQKKNKEKSA